MDIDWFFTNSDEIGFAASGGGQLPRSVAKSAENLELLALYFKNLPEKYGVIINPSLDKIITDGVDERYLKSFVQMAKKGLFSFDRTVLNSFTDPNYHLVAKPVSPLKTDELPSEIVKILMETRYSGNIGSILDSSQII